MELARFGDKVVYPSIPAMYQARSREGASLVTIYRKERGAWRASTNHELATRIRRLTLGLLARGVRKGDRVAIVSDTRLEWSLADLAILHAGAVTVGVYPTLPADDVAYQLAHSEARVVFVENRSQLDKVQSVRTRLPLVEKLVVFDAPPGAAEGALTLADLEQERDDPEAFDRTWRAVAEGDLATIIYTSGTTGPPKGALLTHGNLTFVLASASSVIPSTHEDLGIAFLPLAHALQRIGGYVAIYNGVRGAYAESIDKLLDNWRELRPTVQVSVPRIWEKIHARIQAGLATAPFHRRAAFAWAHGVGRRSAPFRKRGERLPPLLALEWSLARRFWRSVLLPRLGFERVRFLTSGGAPISTELLEFFYALDVLILEGWGLTETAAPATFNRPDAFEFGTVGRALPGVEVEVAEDGELLVRGPGVFRGYYKDEEATRAAFDERGFFRTGDIGTIDARGFVRITDRKKNLIVTSLGKKVPPQNLENLFRESPFLGPCLIHGDRRKFLSALFTLDPAEVLPWARSRGIAATAMADLARHEEVRRLVADVVTRVNARLPSFEQVKRWAVVPEEWTVENGALTPTLKTKRKALEERYRAILDSFYDDDGAAPQDNGETT